MKRLIGYLIVMLVISLLGACTGGLGPSDPLPLGTFEGEDRGTETRLIISDNSYNLIGEAFTKVNGKWQELGPVGGLNADQGGDAGPLLSIQPDGPVFDGVYKEGVFRGNTMTKADNQKRLGSFRFELVE